MNFHQRALFSGSSGKSGGISCEPRRQLCCHRFSKALLRCPKEMASEGVRGVEYESLEQSRALLRSNLARSIQVSGAPKVHRALGGHPARGNSLIPENTIGHRNNALENLGEAALLLRCFPLIFRKSPFSDRLTTSLATCISLVLFAVVFMASAVVAGADSTPAPEEMDVAGHLEQAFRAPPDEAKLWVYWWWLNGNVTKESITHDLEEMKRQGIGGVLMFDARGYHDDLTPPPPVRIEYLGAQWLRMLRHALAEARRLGIAVSINLSSSAGAVGGTWPVGDDAPKRLVHTALEVAGPMHFTAELPRPSGKRIWDVAVVAARHDERPADAKKPLVVTNVVDMTNKLDAQGRLVWDVPPGRWTVLRFAYTRMEGHEKDVDVLSGSAVEGHFRRMGRLMLEQAGPPQGRALTRFYSVSWEGAVPTWTGGLDKEFQRRRGYDIRPWLPALAEMTVKSPELSRRFLRDYYRTLGDLFRDNCYGKLRELCRREGLEWHSESGGPWSRKIPNFKHADQLAFLARNDVPQGEFWLRPNNYCMCRPAAMTAHTYGLPLAAVEAFTMTGPHWREYPAMVKPFGDMAFCDGANQFIWHTFAASPAEFGKPGIVYFAGTHLNPNVTWWEQSRALLSYLARCQWMLRQGRFVADVCCYVGDTPYLHWGRGDKWTEKPSLLLGDGYAYDLLSDEVLLHRLSVQDGDLVLPDGMRYHLLVVAPAEKTVPPESKRLTKTNVRRDPKYQGKRAQLRGYLSTDALAPAGLIGPVQLEFGQEHRVRIDRVP